MVLVTAWQFIKQSRIVNGITRKQRSGNLFPQANASRAVAGQMQDFEAIDAVVTEYGIANLKWRTIRERAQALIDVAHPDDRGKLVEQAKQKKQPKTKS